MKVIFLDIDGVCTSNKSGKSYQTITNENQYDFDYNCLAEIFRIIQHTGAKIIFSTNWRKFDDNGYWIYNGMRIINPLPKLKEIFKYHWIDILPPERHILKSQALQLYFEYNQNNDIDNYVIFDDDLLEQYQISKFKDHFILTFMQTGITKENADKAISLLNK